MIRNTVVSTLVVLACAGLASAAEQSERSGSPADPVKEARALVAAFQQELSSKLVAALSEGGPVRAVEVCKVEAPAIAARLSQESGWQIKRVGTRARNTTTGRADAWEQRQLADFAQRLASGESPATLNGFEEIRQSSGRVQRYAQAIPMGASCLACHGAVETQAPELRRALQAAYPGDEAVGYREGELRGAFSLARKLP